MKGSGRSIEEYSMYEELCKCRELLEKFGGHPMAAGLSLPEENVDKFREKINACANLTEDDLIPKIKIDIPMPAAYADAGLIREFAVLEPLEKPISNHSLPTKPEYHKGFCGRKKSECVAAEPGDSRGRGGIGSLFW